VNGRFVTAIGSRDCALTQWLMSHKVWVTCNQRQMLLITVSIWGFHTAHGTLYKSFSNDEVAQLVPPRHCATSSSNHLVVKPPHRRATSSSSHVVVVPRRHCATSSLSLCYLVVVIVSPRCCATSSFGLVPVVWGLVGVGVEWHDVCTVVTRRSVFGYTRTTNTTK
jgi:hypothetical protein